MYQVQKKDGSLVDFDQNKIITGIIAAGGTPEDAQKIIASIETWLPAIVIENIIKASDIRVKVIEELKVINPIAATNFESYQKNLTPPTGV